MCKSIGPVVFDKKILKFYLCIHMRIKGLARSKSNETNILCQIQDFQAAFMRLWKLKNPKFEIFMSVPKS